MWCVNNSTIRFVFLRLHTSNSTKKSQLQHGSEIGMGKLLQNRHRFITTNNLFYIIKLHTSIFLGYDPKNFRAVLLIKIVHFLHYITKSSIESTMKVVLRKEKIETTGKKTKQIRCASQRTKKFFGSALCMPSKSHFY